MPKIIDALLDGIDSFIAWFGASLKQNVETYCDLETADSSTCLVAHNGSLVSIFRFVGISKLVGTPEFERLVEGVTRTLNTGFKYPGHALQVFFQYDNESVRSLIEDIFSPARQTGKRLELDLEDLFQERVNCLSRYCAEESIYLVLWTTPMHLSADQLKESNAEKLKSIRRDKLPPFLLTQNLIAPVKELRDGHESFVRSILNDFHDLSLHIELMEVHDALHVVRKIADPEFTDARWRPLLPGDEMSAIREYRHGKGLVGDLLWPNLAKQLLPRDTDDIDMRTVRVGDRVYSSVFIDLFPRDILNFTVLFNRAMSANIPWRISFLIESGGYESLKFKSMLASILSFASVQNRLFNGAHAILKYFKFNSDEAIVRLRATVTTWAPAHNVPLLRSRVSELAKAVQGWGGAEVSEFCGDPLGGVVSSMLGMTLQNMAVTSVAPMQEVVRMMPFTRPSSPWKRGALLFRTPDGKPWPYQPGSNLQTTWIDLIYARPGSGKSVLSNMINLALCLSAGIQRLPHIAVIDIGPSSSGLISLLQEALPQEQQHLVAYHRLRMTPDYSINPFDTQLGARFPSPAERGFLVNFFTLLATPLGAEKPYDGMADLAGMVVNELYKQFADDQKPTNYTAKIEPLIDGILEEIGFVRDVRTTWWEVTDALFLAGFTHEAMLAQRYAMPLVADAAAICRIPAIEDLYGKIIAPTGETLINAFSRMISAAVREYPLLSRVTKFDLGESRVVSLDLDEVAKAGGDAADRQTAVMYMLARYVLARHYYLTEDMVDDVPPQYREYHRERVKDIREDPKRIIYDEFHRTSRVGAVRDQVIVDMREGRKWNVQIALISQSLEDFDSVMVEFATAVYIMDAGPTQAIKRSAEIFGLDPTAQAALRNNVHGPREGGGTFLAQFATKEGMHLQLLTNTIGPIELWAFSTTAEDANLRNQLYALIGPAEARRLLATIFPGGSCRHVIEKRLNYLKEQETGFIEDESASLGVVESLAHSIVEEYRKNPNMTYLPDM